VKLKTEVCDQIGIGHVGINMAETSTEREIIE